MRAIAWHGQARPRLELKTWARSCLVCFSVSMIGDHNVTACINGEADICEGGHSSRQTFVEADIH
jgi:hypothetical protein